MPIRPSLPLSIALALVGLVWAVPVQATPVVYTFEAPNFTLGQTTPLLNVAPNVNPGTFLASFTDSTTPNGFQITNLAEAAIITGQALFSPFVVDPLNLAFNTPISTLIVNFAIDVANGSPAGALRLVTPSGSIVQAGSNVGGQFQGGTLTFSAGVPFTTATLQALTSAGAPTQFEIDNLQLDTSAVSTVPEPATLMMLGTGLVVLTRRRSRR
jgi:PEP-CTERM motif